MCAAAAGLIFYLRAEKTSRVKFVKASINWHHHAVIASITGKIMHRGIKYANTTLCCDRELFYRQGQNVHPVPEAQMR